MAHLEISDQLLEKINTICDQEGITVEDWLNQQVAIANDEQTSAQTSIDDLKQLLASGSAYVWSVAIDENGVARYTYVSSAVETITGYPLEFYLKDVNNWMNTVHPDDTLRIRAEVAEMVTQLDTTYYQEYRIIRPDQTVRWLGVHILVTDVTNETYRLDGIVFDITQYRMALQDLQKIEARWRSLVANIPSVLFEFDLDGIIQYINYSSTEDQVADILGTHYLDYASPADKIRVPRYVEQVIITGEPVSYETQGIDGTWYSVKVGPVKQDGRVTSILMLLNDISELKQAELNLKNVQYFMDQAERIAKMGSFDWNLVNETIDWSRNLYKVLGLPDSNDQEAFSNIIHPEDFNDVMRDYQELFTNKYTTYQIEYRIVRSDSSVRHVKTVLEPRYNEDGQAERVIGYTQDVTDMRAAKALELERTRLALQLDQERKSAQLRAKLISIISHEFRTPLTIILASISMLANYQDRLSPEKQSQKITSITQQVDYLDQLLDQISTLSKANLGFLEYHPTQTNIADLCKRVIEQMSHAAQDLHEINLELNLQHADVNLDAKLMTHALTNLLSNAIKYSPTGSPIKLQVNETSTKWEFCVIDQGIGIPPEEQEQLREPFNRASNVGNIRGTGLGLSIVDEVAKQHAGHLEIISKVDEGSTFKIILPK